MANTDLPPIEDVLAKYVGYTVGVGVQTGSTEESAADAAYYGQSAPTVAADLKLSAVRDGTGGNQWFKVLDHNEYWSGDQGSKPPSQKGAVTFWRRMGSDVFANWEWLMVGITATKRDSGSSGNDSVSGPTDGTTSNTADPVNKIGTAWEPIIFAVPKLTSHGRDSKMDFTTLQLLGDTLEAIAKWTDEVWGYLNNDISGIDTKATNFEGTAAQGFRDLVVDAQRGMADIQTAATKNWNTQLDTAATATKEFVDAMNASVATWRNPGDGSHADTWVHPLRLIANMFNQSRVTEIEEIRKGADSTDNNNHSGGLWETSIIKGGQSVIYDTDAEGNSSIAGYKTMIIKFPAWANVESDFGGFDVLKPPSWEEVDRKTRAAWVKKVEDAFSPAIAKLNPMVTAISAASTSMTLKEMEAAKGPTPIPGGPDLNDTLNDIYSHFSDINGAFSDINGAFSDINGAFSDINSGFSDINGAFSDINGAFSDINGGFSDINGAFSDINGAFSDINGAFSDVNGAFSDVNGAFSDVNGAFSDVNGAFSDVNGAFSDLNGGLSDVNNNLNGLFSSVNGATGDDLGVGQLSPALALSRLAGSNLNDLGDQETTLGGGTLGDPQNLGDLNTEQLQALADRGLLDDTPLTDEQRDILTQAGLSADGLDSLGDLSDEQLETLRQAGALDDTAITPEQTSGLLGSGLLGVGEGADDLGDLSMQQLQTLQDDGLLDNVQLTDEDLAELQKQGLLGSDTSGLNDLGDLNSDQLKALSDAGLLDDIPTTQDQISALDAAGQLGATDGSIQNLGDLSPAQLAELDSSGQLDNVPVTDEQLQQLQKDGLLGQDTTGIDSLGDLSSSQLEDLRQKGLLDETQLSTGQLSALDDAGLLGTPDNLSNSLGDLTSTQLSSLDASNLLDDNPITQDQIDELTQQGLLDNGAQVGSLGDLNTDQLAALDQAGLLDDIPVTADQSTALGIDGLGDLSSLGSSTPSSAFPTNIDGLDISPVAETPTGTFGDITQPLTGGVPGGSGTTGFSTGGMNTSPGFEVGDLIDHDAKVTAAGTGAIGGPDDPLTGDGSRSISLGQAMSSGSGMPMMPMGGMGGMGGAGAGAADAKERERQTWLVEEDDIWGTDPEVGAAVIGRGDFGSDSEEEQDYGREIVPDQPGAPRRARRTARG